MGNRIRISASVIFALVAALVAFTWGRSFYYFDQVTHAAGAGAIGIESAQGQIRLSQLVPLEGRASMPGEWGEGWNVASGPYQRTAHCEPRYVPLDYDRCVGTARSVEVPYWFLVMASMSLTAAPWIEWRYSLRSVFLFSTILAVLMGLLRITT